MAKATSASKARKEQMLQKFTHDAVIGAGLREAQFDRDAVNDWRGSWWAAYLDSHETTEMMALRILGEDGMVSDDMLLKSLMGLIPGAFSVHGNGTSISEVIQQAQRLYGNGVVIDEDVIYNGIVRRFARKLLKLTPTLYIGINTDDPEEVMYYDGPAPSWNAPDGFAGDWVLTPDYACVIFKKRDLFVPKKEYRTERERVLKLIEMHHSHYRRLMEWAARDEILVLTRKFTETGEGERVGSSDDIIAEMYDSEESWTHGGYLARLKTPSLGMHESHRMSSVTIEASAAALAKVMMEEIVGRNYYTPPIFKDGVWQRQLVFEEVGLIGQLDGTSEDLRRHIRLVAFLHMMGSLYYLDGEKVGRDRQIYRTYKRMSPEMIANEWSADSGVDNPRVLRSFPGPNGEPVDNEVYVLAAKTEDVNLKGSAQTQESKRYLIEDCEICHKTHWQGDAGHPGTITKPRQVFDKDSRHFFGDNDEYMVMIREITTRTEFQSFEDSLTKRKMAKAMDAFFTLMQLARHQLMDAEGFIEGPKLANGLFYSKLHPANSGRSLDYVRTDAEGIRHPITDAMGWWFDWQWDTHSSYDPTTRVKAYSDTQFGDGPTGDHQVYGSFSHFYIDRKGERRVLNLRGVVMHPEHEGCLMDGKIAMKRVTPTYTVSELDDLPETPLVDSRVKNTRTEKDIFNETLTSLLNDIKFGES